MATGIKWSRALAVPLLLLSGTAAAFDSGSTGADGVFNPTVDTSLPLPPDGVFNFTEVNIPSGVAVTFEKNPTNTPVTILASGDVLIGGTINLNGRWSTPVGAAGNGNLGDDGIPGEGGPGGYSGGRGGEPDPTGTTRGGRGLGPGGGGEGRFSTRPRGGGGGGFGSSGANGGSNTAPGGGTYGSELLLPLVGGSGGGGGMGGQHFHGSGGGGGGGALLIAASGTVRINGAIRAQGGNSGDAAGTGVGGTGGGGSGGAIRIVATRIAGNGTINAGGGTRGVASGQSSSLYGGNGGSGRIRLEAEIFDRTSGTNPTFSFGEPSSVFVSGLLSLRIDSVAGIAVPAEPTGYGDITLPEDTPNPVTVVFRTTGVPVGNTVRLYIVPAHGPRSSVVSPALTGSTDEASASVDVDIPDGPSTLLAETTYTVIGDSGTAMFDPYTDGEAVARVRLAATLDGGSIITLITVSGREVPLPANIPAWPAGIDS